MKIIPASLHIIALPALVAAIPADEVIEVPNPRVDLSSCKDLGCSPGQGTICSTGDDSEPRGVGIAASAISISSSADGNDGGSGGSSGPSLSFTLVDGLRTNAQAALTFPEMKYSSLQLYVGVDEAQLDGDGAGSNGCALMLQYDMQTFPKRLDRLGEDEVRGLGDERTTSCLGALDVFCQSEITQIIRTYNSSSSSGEEENDGNGQGGTGGSNSERCTDLARYITSQLSQNPRKCGGEGNLLSGKINVTGGALPGPDSRPAVADDENKGLGDECQPVLPSSRRLYEVADVLTWYLADPPTGDSDYFSRLLPGRAGFTPVATVVFGGADGNDSVPDVQFICMKTFDPDGEQLKDPFGSGGGLLVRPSLLLCLVAALIWMAV